MQQYLMEKIIRLSEKNLFYLNQIFYYSLLFVDILFVN